MRNETDLSLETTGEVLLFLFFGRYGVVGRKRTVVVRLSERERFCAIEMVAASLLFGGVFKLSERNE